MGRRRNELRNAADLVLELRIIVAVRAENQFFYANFSAPPLLASAPSLHLLWRRHWAQPSLGGTSFVWGAQAVIWGGTAPKCPPPRGAGPAFK